MNFFPLETNQFTITLYRLPYVEGAPPILEDEVGVRRNLEVDGTRDLYWTSFQPPEGGIEIELEAFDNIYATIDALRTALIQSCRSCFDPHCYRITEGIRRRVEIVVAEDPVGSQFLAIEPYLLRSRDCYGFLADLRFHPNEGFRGTRRALELSLSLDESGQQNRDYYADRYSYLMAYVKNIHSRIFPISVPGGQELAVEADLIELSPETLDIKTYVVGSGKESRSQFMGIKQAGPYKETEGTHLYFLYRPEDRPLSHDLFRALRGETFRTFEGMERMFRLPLSRENVHGASLSEFSPSEIDRVRDRVVSDAAGRSVVPIVLTPFSKHDTPEKNAAYWKLKHAFLSKGLPIQVVAAETVANKSKLKWSTASIGLQIFAKIGGTPWKVRPRTERCLIVGIGQAHRVSNQGIDRFFAYSVLTDSSGVFEEVRVLGRAQDEQDYINSFSANLQQIFSDYRSRFSSFVVHATFAIRRRELEIVARELEKQQRTQKEGGEFVSMKFNDRNRFFGFALDHNSRVPYESTVLHLSRREFLVWFEGLQYGQSALRDMIGGPLQVQFTYPQEGLAWPRQKAHLQDAINLSGANWRGFNAKSLPVSVYYAQLIAKYLKEFEGHELPEVDVGILKPWFL